MSHHSAKFGGHRPCGRGDTLWLESHVILRVSFPRHTCTRMAIHVPKKSCTVLIPLCKNNLNQPMSSSFFLPCAWLPPPLVHVVMLATSLRCTVLIFFFVFYRSRFCSPAINQISLSQSKGCFPFILLCRQEKYCLTGPLGFCTNYTNRISELYLQMYSLKNYLIAINIT